jgi:Tfp pilus assembly protein PilO
MDRRTKILAALFGAVLVYVVFSNVVYPQWIEPQLTIEDRIAERQEEFDELYEQKKQVDAAAERYRALVARVGSFDIGNVETDLRARLNELIERHRLENANVSPTRPTEDRKTGLSEMTINVTATGRFKGTVEFLRDVAELPQLVRVGNASLYPASESRSGSRDRVNLRVPLEVMVLPEKRRIVGRIEEEELVQPETHPRHAGLDYSLIWSRKPFLEPIPLKANAGRDVTAKEGQATRLKATASGGDGEYVSWQWEPSEGLDDPTIANPTLDTSTAFTRRYTVTVVDAAGETASDEVSVTIREKPKPPEAERDTVVETEPPEPPGPQRWRDGKYMQLCMVLMRSSEAGEIGELMVHNKRAHETEYYAVGDEFDGGELVSVQPRGGVVRRGDKYYVYPVGGWLDQDVRAEDAAVVTEYPELKLAADEHREQVKAQLEAEQEAEGQAEADEQAGQVGQTEPSEQPDAETSTGVAAPDSDETAAGPPGEPGAEGAESEGKAKAPGERAAAPAPPAGTRRGGPSRTPVRPRNTAGRNAGKTPQAGRTEGAKTESGDKKKQDERKRSTRGLRQRTLKGRRPPTKGKAPQSPEP